MSSEDSLAKFLMWVVAIVCLVGTIISLAMIVCVPFVVVYGLLNLF